MKNSAFQFSLIALALNSAFSGNTFAQSTNKDQTLQEVVVSASRTNKVEASKVGAIWKPIYKTHHCQSLRFQAPNLQDLRIRQTTDAAKFDASVNDAYNAVGYSRQFSIRGFALDNASSYRKDGFAIPRRRIDSTRE